MLAQPKGRDLMVRRSDGCRRDVDMKTRDRLPLTTHFDRPARARLRRKIERARPAAMFPGYPPRSTRVRTRARRRHAARQRRMRLRRPASIAREARRSSRREHRPSRPSRATAASPPRWSLCRSDARRLYPAPFKSTTAPVKAAAARARSSFDADRKMLDMHRQSLRQQVESLPKIGVAVTGPRRDARIRRHAA